MKKLLLILLLCNATVEAQDLIPYAVDSRANVQCALTVKQNMFVKGKKKRNRLKFSSGIIRHSCRFPKRFLNGHFVMPAQTFCVGETFRLLIYGKGERTCRVRKIKTR